MVTLKSRTDSRCGGLGSSEFDSFIPIPNGFKHKNIHILIYTHIYTHTHIHIHTHTHTHKRPQTVAYDEATDCYVGLPLSKYRYPSTSIALYMKFHPQPQLNKL